MDTKKIKRWVKALRSGKYKQHRGGYNCIGPRGKSFCCLGVAGELGFGYREFEVCDKMGILDHQSDLIRLNDRAHYSFSKIADWVEKNILNKKEKS